MPMDGKQGGKLLVNFFIIPIMKQSTLLSLASTGAVLVLLFLGSAFYSCTDDDADYGNTDFVTLADERMTRAGESSSTPYVPVTKDSTVMCKSVDTTIIQSMGVYADAVIHVTSQQGYNWEINPKAGITFNEYGYCKEVTKTYEKVEYDGNSIDVTYSVEIEAEDPLTKEIIVVKYSGGVSVPVSKIKVAGK